MYDFKMTKEQKKLFDGLTRLQQEIAVNSISGMSDIDSYKASSGKSKKENTMRASVCEILANPNVAAFVDSMKAAAVSSAVMSREEMMERQTQIINIEAARLDSMSLEELTELKGGLDIQLKAMNQLATLAGYNKATEVNLNHKKAEDSEW